MSGWKDLLIDTLKLTDEVKSLDRRTEKLYDYVVGMDKRLVRLETMVEVASRDAPKRQLPKDEQ